MAEKTVFLGFDGFVDRILRPVKSKNGEEAVPFESMADFAGYLLTQKGRSCSVETELIATKIGGNMPNTAKALGELGINTLCLGAMGLPEISPEFLNMPKNCKLLSVSEPGCCDALEFSDGKVMLGINSAIDELDYAKIIEVIPESEFISALNRCNAAAFLNWGEMTRSNDIWENIAKRILPRCDFYEKPLLVDFSDFSRRSGADFSAMLEIFKRLKEYFDITVSLNENEIHLALNNSGEVTDSDLLSASELFFGSSVVIHLHEGAKYTEGGKVHTAHKEIIKNPKVVTGAGDNFNGGLMAGLLEYKDLGRAVRLANKVVNHYITHGNIAKMKNALFYGCN